MNVLLPPLTSHPFLASLSTDNLLFLDSLASRVTTETGRYTFKKGKNADQFYIINSGTLALQVPTKDRGPIHLMTLNPGELLGWS